MENNKIYQKIISQNGLNDFKSLIEKLEKLSNNISEIHSDMPIILPDLFLVSHTGTGRTHIIKLLAEYLSDRPNLMTFYGDVKYFEFLLNYCEPKEYFTEIQRLMNEIDNAAGFRSEYRGIVFVDVDEWRGHFEEKHFVSFMEYLSSNSDNWLVILSVSDDRQDQISRMEAVVSSYLRIQRLTIEEPTIEELIQYAKKMLGAYGLKIDVGAEKLIEGSIKELCNNKYFDGYKTVKRFCEDISYTLYMEGFKNDREVSAIDLGEFAKDGNYIQRMIVKFEKTKKIGF